MLAGFCRYNIVRTRITLPFFNYSYKSQEKKHGGYYSYDSGYHSELLVVG